MEGQLAQHIAELKTKGFTHFRDFLDASLVTPELLATVDSAKPQIDGSFYVPGSPDTELIQNKVSALAQCLGEACGMQVSDENNPWPLTARPTVDGSAVERPIAAIRVGENQLKNGGAHGWHIDQ